MAESRRAYRRVTVELPVSLRWRTPRGTERQISGKTENVSRSGLFVVTPVRLRRETPVSFTVILPQEVTRVPIELACQGRVVRSSGPGELSGFVAIIDDYELRPAPLPA
jgi:hypothetical protein